MYISIYMNWAIQTSLFQILIVENKHKHIYIYKRIESLAAQNF